MLNFKFIENNLILLSLFSKHQVPSNQASFCMIRRRKFFTNPTSDFAINKRREKATILCCSTPRNHFVVNLIYYFPCLLMGLRYFTVLGCGLFISF